MIRGVRFADIDGEALLASIFRGLVEWVWVASLPVSWLGLCRLGVVVCRVSPRGGRAVPGARGVFLQDRGGQEMSSACLRGGECLEAPEPGKQKAGPGVVGLVAQDGAAGMAGDDGGGGHQPQPDRLGLPGAGGGVGQGEQLGEGQQVTGQGHDQAPDTVLGEPLQGKAVKPGVLGTADTVPWQRARSRWRTSRSASCPAFVLVAKAVSR